MIDIVAGAVIAVCLVTEGALIWCVCKSARRNRKEMEKLDE